VSEKPPPHEVTGLGGIKSEESFGEPRAVRLAPRDWLVRGYRSAYERLEAASQPSNDPDEMFLPLFEALSWAGSLEEKLRPHDNHVLSAVRFARNRVLHQWADTLEAREYPAPIVHTNRPGGSRIIMPPFLWDWFWREVHELPSPSPRLPDRHGKRCYVELLAGRRARDALTELLGIF
jgi:hypothetical protein